MKLIKNEKGQSMVETALVLPIVLLLLLGIFDFGWLFYNKLNVENCARDGARYAAVYYDIDDTINSDKAVREYVKKLKPNLSDSNITIIPVSFGGKNNAFLEVKINTNVKTLTPLIGAFFDNGTCHMEASCTFRREKPESTTT